MNPSTTNTSEEVSFDQLVDYIFNPKELSRYKRATLALGTLENPIDHQVIAGMQLLVREYNIRNKEDFYKVYETLKSNFRFVSPKQKAETFDDTYYD